MNMIATGTGTTRQVDLSARAMLAVLSMSAWTAAKLDKGATREVTRDKGAREGAAQLRKRLFDSDALTAAKAERGAARSEFYRLTSPWLDDGARILSASNFYRLRDAMEASKASIATADEAFFAAYADAVRAAPRLLGDLYDAADYPPVDAIRSKFGFEFRLLPFPSAADFRVDIGDAQVEDIRRAIEQDTRSALDGAMKDAWSRIADATRAMVDRLGAYKPATGDERATGIFRDSLVANVRDLVDILPSLNLTGDSKLADVCERMRVELCTFDAGELRESDHARAKVAAEAKAILDEVSDYLA